MFQGADYQAGKSGSRSMKSPWEENRAIFLEVQKKVFLQASLIGWHLIFSDQLKNLKTYPRGQILQEAKKVGDLR
ncbi:mCG1042720 [Mus musculus]|jgi:hypothetical protein|nr:mCG1042720 [Mus musculus]